MAHNPVSASRLPADDPFFDAKPGSLPAKSETSHYTPNRAASDYDPRTQYVGRPVIRHLLNTNAGGPRPEAHPLHSGPFSQTNSRPHNLQESLFPFPGSYFPSVHGNPQHQPGSDSAFPPVVASYFPQTYVNRRDRGLLESPSAVGDLTQAPINQQRSDLVKSPTSGENTSPSQPNSVKHLTCWYWANKGCKLPEHVCLYSHHDTGRNADPPVQVQRGRGSPFPSVYIYTEPFSEPLFE